MSEATESPITAVYDMLLGKRVRVNVHMGSDVHYTVSGTFEDCDSGFHEGMGNICVTDCAKSFEELFGMPYGQYENRPIIMLGRSVRSIAPETDGYSE